MRRVLVTTTIHVPTNLRDWATQLSPGDRIIVAGDLKTPHTEVRELLEVLALTYGITTSYRATTPSGTGHTRPLGTTRSNGATWPSSRHWTTMSPGTTSSPWMTTTTRKVVTG
jgi:hypothetical protein